MEYTLNVVTGAPGAGKSSALEAFLRLESPFLAFDIDWLADTASDLAQRDIYQDPSTWQPYGHLWFEILLMIYKNGRTPVFFSPNDPYDFQEFGIPSWCQAVNWILLDCPDEIRMERLRKRPSWTDQMIAAALEDAHQLRMSVGLHLDTNRSSPKKIAREICNWLEQEVI